MTNFEKKPFTTISPSYHHCAPDAGGSARKFGLWRSP
jgi:hypothetical protein